MVPSIAKQYLTMPDSTTKLIAYLLEQAEEDHKIMGYGILKDIEKDELASQLLSTLQENNSTSYPLIHSQECLNQRGLPNVNENSQFQTLLTLANQNNSSAGFARGVYEYLTGISINIDRPFPTLLFPRSVNRNEKMDEILIFPNPTGRKNITISLPDFDEGDLYIAEITDMMNKGLFSQSINQQSTQVDISTLPESILIVTIYKNNFPIQRIKLLNL
ncbi:MAG: T9SS type A sorting domain-containing protein [Saprospiraceae bacterium]|nr:T9SS type A sorting domain-containing protein [Saprospiraceae bacterium]